MKDSLVVFIVMGFLLMVGMLFSQEGYSYKVIVNKENPVSELTKDKVSKLLLKKITKWDNGKKVQPVDLSAKSDIRERFTEEIHGKSIAAIKAYWQKKIFSGKGIPPAEKRSDKEVIAYVKAKPDGIGYVSLNTNTSGVKVVKISN